MPCSLCPAPYIPMSTSRSLRPTPISRSPYPGFYGPLPTSHSHILLQCFFATYILHPTFYSNHPLHVLLFTHSLLPTPYVPLPMTILVCHTPYISFPYVSLKNDLISTPYSIHPTPYVVPLPTPHSHVQFPYPGAYDPVPTS